MRESEDSRHVFLISKDVINHDCSGVGELIDWSLDHWNHECETVTTRFLSPAEGLAQPIVRIGPDESAHFENLEHLWAAN